MFIKLFCCDMQQHDTFLYISWWHRMLTLVSCLFQHLLPRQLQSDSPWLSSHPSVLSLCTSLILNECQVCAGFAGFCCVSDMSLKLQRAFFPSRRTLRFREHLVRCGGSPANKAHFLTAISSCMNRQLCFG